MTRRRKIEPGDDIPGFQFPAIVYKVQTLIDNGIRVTLDLPEDAIPQMAMLAECQRQGIPIVVKVEAEA